MVWNPWKIFVQQFIFSKILGLLPVTFLKKIPSQNFLRSLIIYFRTFNLQNVFQWLLPKFTDFSLLWNWWNCSGSSCFAYSKKAVERITLVFAKHLRRSSLVVKLEAKSCKFTKYSTFSIFSFISVTSSNSYIHITKWHYFYSNRTEGANAWSSKK